MLTRMIVTLTLGFQRGRERRDSPKLCLRLPTIVRLLFRDFWFLTWQMAKMIPWGETTDSSTVVLSLWATAIGKYLFPVLPGTETLLRGKIPVMKQQQEQFHGWGQLNMGGWSRTALWC